MKKSKRIAIIIALVCVIAGFAIVALSLVTIGFDFTKINTMSFEKVTHTVNDGYDKVDISNIECDVIIKYRANTQNITLVESTESDEIINTVEVDDETLVIRRVDTRSWYERLAIWWNKDPVLTVYLPKKNYSSLKLSTTSGDVFVTNDFKFEESELKTVSGDIKFEAYSGQLVLNSTSGNITCNDSQDLSIHTTSGDIYILSANLITLDIKTTSGDINIKELFLSNEGYIKTTSGDVEFEYIEGEGDIEIKTTSGDIEGIILQKMNYIPKTTSGDIDIPRSSDSAPDCKLTTTSGDIEVDERILPEE